MMIRNTYRVVVDESTDFLDSWKDERVPHMEFMFDQESIEECENIDGVYYATYKTWEVAEARQVTYVEPDGTLVTIDVPVGEYGLRVN